MKEFFKGIRKKGQGNKFVKEGTKALGHSGTKDLNCSLTLGETLVEPTNEVELSETACRMAEWLGRGGNPLQNDEVTCAPLAGEPKSLISKGGKNVVNCFSTYNNKKGRHPEGDNPKDLQTLGSRFFALHARIKRIRLRLASSARVAQNDVINKTVKTLFPYFPIPFSLNKKLRRFRIKSGMTFIKQPAFSLAETLITLGIIGVVAALTIPGLMTKYHRHVVETKLVKFDSIINQAVRMSIAENDDLVFTPPGDTVDKGKYLKEWFDENLMKYIKADYDGGLVGGKYYKLIFHDGTGFVAYIPESALIHFFYCLDAKDKSCKPESYDGKNTFVFNYEPSQKAVLPYGEGITNISALKYSTANSSRGCYIKDDTRRHLCALLIKQNGWKIPDDYPWIK